MALRLVHLLLGLCATEATWRNTTGVTVWRFNSWTKLDICADVTKSILPNCDGNFDKKSCLGVGYIQTELDTRDILPEVVADDDGQTKSYGDYVTTADDDGKMIRSTIPTVAALSVFTSEKIQGDTKLSVEIVDQTGKIVVPKASVDLASHNSLVNAINSNNECRQQHSLEDHSKCFPLDTMTAQGNRRLIDSRSPEINSYLQLGRRLLQDNKHMRALSEAYSHFKRRLRGKKKKKKGASATGFFGVDGSHGESRRKEFGDFTSAIPHVFTMPYAGGAKKPLNHWFWWKISDPGMAGLDAVESRSRENHAIAVEKKLKDSAVKPEGRMVYGFDFGKVWKRFTKEYVKWGTDGGEQKVLQVQQTSYGYVGKYNHNLTADGLRSMGVDYTEEWDCHDVLSLGFQVETVGRPKYFIRVYNTSTAHCGSYGDTTIRRSDAVAVALSSATVFDECAEYAAWACDRPSYKKTTFVLAGIVGAGLLFFTYDYYRPKSKASVTNEEEEKGV